MQAAKRASADHNADAGHIDMAEWDHLHPSDSNMHEFVQSALQIAVLQRRKPGAVPSPSQQLLEAALGSEVSAMLQSL